MCTAISLFLKEEAGWSGGGLDIEGFCPCWALTEDCRRVNGTIMLVLSSCMLRAWLSTYKLQKKRQILCPPHAAYDKAVCSLRTPFALIHLCQKKTGKTEETLRQDSNEKCWGGSWVKRTPEITTAFERQVQYRELGKCWKWRWTI